METAPPARFAAVDSRAPADVAHVPRSTLYTAMCRSLRHAARPLGGMSESRRLPGARGLRGRKAQPPPVKRLYLHYILLEHGSLPGEGLCV